MSALTPRPDDAVRLDRGELGISARVVDLDAGALAQGAALVPVFLAELTRGVARKLLVALVLAPAFGLAVFAAVRGEVDAFAVLPTEARTFVLDQLRRGFVASAAWGLLATATVAAGQVPRDVRAGALLLYFTRPVERGDYLAGRWLATGAWLFAAMLVPQLLSFAVTLRYFAPALALDAQLGWVASALALLAALGVATLVVATWLALVGVGVGAWLQGAAGAGLALAGAVLGSSVLASVLVSIWGRDSGVGTLDLFGALSAPLYLLTLPLLADKPPAIATLEAAAGCALWTALAIGAGRVAVAVVRAAPLGKGRS